MRTPFRVGDVTVLCRAVSGNAEINPAECRQLYTVMSSSGDFYSQSTLRPSRRHCAASIWIWPSPGCRLTLKETLGGILTEFIGDPRGYVTDHFCALRDFYLPSQTRTWRS